MSLKHPATDDERRARAAIIAAVDKSEKQRLIGMTVSAIRKDRKIKPGDRTIIIEAVEKSKSANLSNPEKLRLKDLAIVAVRKDVKLAQIDKFYLVEMLRKLFRGRGHAMERPHERAQRWFKNPVNRVAGFAAWTIREWQKKNKVTNHRVMVNGKPVGIHEAAAREAIKHYRALGHIAPSEVTVVALLRKGSLRTMPR